MKMMLRPTEVADIPAIVALQREAFPPPFPEDHLWQPSHLQNHLRVFPMGQYVVVRDDMLVGSISNLLVPFERLQQAQSWDDVTGGFDMARHTDKGDVLFGADIAVAPQHRRQGIGRTLYCKRYEIVRERNLTMFATFVRLPDYCDSGVDDLDRYVAEVLDGDRVDRTLTPLLGMGLQYENLLRHGMDDPESGNAMAVLTWRP